jgi:hypothetical protein
VGYVRYGIRTEYDDRFDLFKPLEHAFRPEIRGGARPDRTEGYRSERGNHIFLSSNSVTFINRVLIEMFRREGGVQGVYER